MYQFQLTHNMHSTDRFPFLSPGEIHVWYAQLNLATKEVEGYKSILSQEELARVNRFKNDVVRYRYIVRRGILRELLSQYTGGDPSDIEIHRDGNGKPHLSNRMNPNNLQFSESDSDSMAAFAFGCLREVGVDIEKIRVFPDMLGVVENNFTKPEQNKIISYSNNERLLLFYKFWTRKEAVLKAQGDGLLNGLDGVDVSGVEHQNFEIASVCVKMGLENYFIKDLKAPPDFAAAVAFTKFPADIIVRQYVHGKN